MEKTQILEKVHNFKNIENFTKPKNIKISLGIGSNFLDAAHGGCKYKAASGHEQCPTPALMDGENDNSVVWKCDDGFEAGSQCVKQCNEDEGWMLKVSKWGTPKVDSECYCKGTCKWKGITTKCSRTGCTSAPPVLTPEPGTYYYDGMTGPKCESSTGEPVDYASALAENFWPEGVRCWNECNPGYQGWGFSDDTTCVCENNQCAFDEQKIAFCMAAACSTDMTYLAAEWSLGFDEDHQISHFGPLEACFANYILTCFINRVVQAGK